MLLALQYYVALQVYILILFKTTHQKNIAKKKKKKSPRGTTSQKIMHNPTACTFFHTWLTKFMSWLPQMVLTAQHGSTAHTRSTCQS